MGVLAFYFFSGDIRVSPDVFQAELLHYWWLPVIVVMVGAYFIAQGCFSVYSMGVNTFTLCLMDDLEHNDGTLQGPYVRTQNRKQDSRQKVRNRKSKN
ncbi:choline transporter-like protein 4 [Hemibagrus wyckioides]|uniref:choline transporter-like protein 4 n=1 Tax=Hemibagrus wyckioides TaxID=337641 RepID=UPI00266CF57B|nr:choline transporter-like protein 4 [Hemibagrus wyckioides]